MAVCKEWDDAILEDLSPDRGSGFYLYPASHINYFFFEWTGLIVGGVVVVLKYLKWGVIVLVSLYILFGVYCMLLPDESPDFFNGALPDFGTHQGFGGTGMTYVESTMVLGDTCYEAKIGSYRDDYSSDPPWKGFLVTVEKRGVETFTEEPMVVYYSFFIRWVRGGDVPMDLWRKGVEDLVSYNPESRVVVFDLGFTNYVCQLPPQDNRKSSKGSESAD